MNGPRPGERRRSLLACRVDPGTGAHAPAALLVRSGFHHRNRPRTAHDCRRLRDRHDPGDSGPAPAVRLPAADVGADADHPGVPGRLAGAARVVRHPGGADRARAIAGSVGADGVSADRCGSDFCCADRAGAVRACARLAGAARAPVGPTDTGCARTVRPCAGRARAGSAFGLRSGTDLACARWFGVGWVCACWSVAVRVWVGCGGAVRVGVGCAVRGRVGCGGAVRV